MGKGWRLGTGGQPSSPSSDLPFPPQRSVVQATPQVPKAGPVQQLTVQGLQPVHVAQEVCISPTYLWANWGWAQAGLWRVQAPGRELSYPGGRRGVGRQVQNDILALGSTSSSGPRTGSRSFRHLAEERDLHSLLPDMGWGSSGQVAA